MQGRLLVAVRDFDSLVGGAEKSLSSLILGVNSLNQNWKINVYQSNDRKPNEELFKNTSIKFEKCDIKIEDIYSGASWKLRNRNTGRSMKFLRRIHLKRKNKLFSNWLKKHFSKEIKLAEKNNEKLLGITQLDWSAGASSAFIENKIPYMVFVRDEVCFQYPELFEECLQNAESVIVAGEGLASQIKEKFMIKSISIVHLPVNFEDIYPQEKLKEKLEEANQYRLKNNLTNPRIAIVGMVPEKGYQFYNKELIPKMKLAWPEATLHVFGGGTLARKLAKHSNTFDEGFCKLEDIYPFCDIHMFRLDIVGTWGRVINEAGYFSKPSISIDIGAQSEAVGLGGKVMPYSASSDEWITELKNIYDDLEKYGNLAFKHRLIVDHKNSINEFLSVIEGVKND
jgi:hypothetical protein|tara:strand:- start:5069 stop:6259 length:1191 start_codon:yes stop_codon:yes gene_type:complete